MHVPCLSIICICTIQGKLEKAAEADHWQSSPRRVLVAYPLWERGMSDHRHRVHLGYVGLLVTKEIKSIFLLG
jgi:hypothetical protein